MTERYDHRDADDRVTDILNEDTEIHQPVMDGANELRAEAAEALETDDTIEDPTGAGH